MKDGIPVLDRAVPEEVPPQELEDQPVGGVVRDPFLLVLPDLHGNERPEVKPNALGGES